MTINSALTLAYDQLSTFAGLDDFWSRFDTAFGTNYDRAIALTFKSQWLAGDFSLFPTIEVVSDQVLGTANGAYGSNNTIYVSEQFLSTASESSLVALLLEEYGHFVDAQINSVDSAGDEGAIFAALVQGDSLGVSMLQALKVEDDHGTITVNGEVIQVEQQDFTGTDGNDTITGTSEDDTISPGLGVDTINGGAGNDLLIIDYSINTYDGIGTSFSSNGSGGFNGYFSAYYNSSAYDRTNFSNIERFQVTGTYSNDSIKVGSGNDILNGGFGDDTLDAGSGNDSIDGGDGTDLLIDDFSSITTAITLDTTGATSIFVVSNTSITSIEAFNVTTGINNDIVKLKGRLNDTLKTQDGDDLINAGLGNDTIDGGAGNDLLILDYSANNYSGISTSFNSGNGYFYAYYQSGYIDDRVNFSNIERFQITGTQVNDSITTGDGNDTIDGGSGNDTINTGDGNDTIDGGSGNDTINAGGGNDVLKGGSGNDTLNAGLGNDSIDGGDGNDLLIDDFSSITTAITLDTIGGIFITPNTNITNVETFNVITGVSNDTIKLKGRFNDTIKTQDGDDLINAGLGNDTIDGGVGNDLLILDYSANSYDGIYTSFNSGNGYFYAYYQSGSPYDRVDFSNIEKFQITGTQVNDSITTGNSNDTINGGSGNDTINTGDGNDTIDGGSGNDTINAGGGNDVLKGGSGNDTLNAGLGNDSIDGGDGNDLLIDDFSSTTTTVTLDNTGASIIAPTGTTISNVEAFNVTTGVGNDTIKLKGRFNDTIKTQDGDDLINAGLGNDTIDGGVGNDLLILDYSANSYDGIYTSFNSGNGYFYAYYQSGNPYDRVDFSNIEKFQITGTQVNDSITTGNSNDTINGGSGNDTINTGDGNDTIDGGSGNDTISAGGGNDVLMGGSGDDTLDAGLGNDSIDGGDGTDLLIDDFSSTTTTVTLDNTGASIIAPTGTTISNVEAFNVTTGVGNDTIKLKGRFNDTIKTQDGDDLISGGLGNDTVDGGAGKDILILDYSANSYSGISTSFNSGSGYFSASNGVTYDRVSFSNIEQFQITGTQVNDSITTGDGNDTLISGGRNDTLNAGGGNDILIGVDPSSSTSGRGELDYLTGGNGNDLFVLGDGLKFFYDDGRTNSAGLGDYADIKDFNSTQDIIQLQGTSTDYFLAVSGSDTQLYFNKPGTEPDELIGVIRNQTSLSLTSSYFSYLTSSSPSITVAVTPSSVSEDGTSNLVYTFTRTGSTTNSLTINYSVGGTAIFNTDYTQTGAATFSSTAGAITFAAGATTATLTVDPTADTVFEDNETINLTLATGNGYIVGTPNTVTGTINNDDSNSVISINDVTVVEGKDANALLTVSVSNPNAQDIRINYTTASINATADTDYTSQTGILVIPANSLTATISISLINDSINETNEAFTVTLSNPINATLDPDVSFGEVTITDTLQSSVNRILPSGVENLTLTGTGNINGTGNTSNNILIGNTGNNILTGAAGKDTLTGGAGIDKFGYKTLTDSLLANYDLITDFNATTGNDLFLVTTARAGFTPGLTVATLDTTGIGTALTTTNFAANYVAQFTFTSGTTTRTFVAINDATAGFNASTDSIVEVTGLTRISHKLN